MWKLWNFVILFAVIHFSEKIFSLNLRLLLCTQNLKQSLILFSLIKDILHSKSTMLLFSRLKKMFQIKVVKGNVSMVCNITTYIQCVRQIFDLRSLFFFNWNTLYECIYTELNLCSSCGRRKFLCNRTKNFLYLILHVFWLVSLYILVL